MTRSAIARLFLTVGILGSYHAYAADCETMLSHILAVSSNNIIGVNNTLPWSIPEDMQFFLDKTEGKTIIMGRKTFESGGHPLPNRLSIVVTRNQNYKSPASSVVIEHDLVSALEYCRSQAKCGDEIFIIGGGEIYRESMHLVDRVYLTRIYKDFEGDVTYPEMDPHEFKLVERRDRYGEIPFSFLIYERRSSRSPK